MQVRLVGACPTLVGPRPPRAAIRSSLPVLRQALAPLAVRWCVAIARVAGGRDTLVGVPVTGRPADRPGCGSRLRTEVVMDSETNNVGPAGVEGVEFLPARER